TMTGDYIIPSTAAIIQRGLDAKKAGGFDLGGACSGFVLALTTGSQFIKAGTARRVLVVGTEKMSYCVDQTKRDTAVLFGEDAGVTPDQLAIVVPHQVNMRILESASEKCGVPLSKMHLNIERVGNTSAASVGIALDEAVRAGKVHRGDLLLTVAFGAGLSWGS